jgi:hypothetical protein
MEDFNFEIILNYCMGTCTIKPPSSFSSLVQVATEKFDIAKINKVVYFDEDEEIRITNEADYLNLFDFVDANSIKQIEIIIKSDQEKVKRRKSLRKNSKTIKPPIKQSDLTYEDGCVNGKLFFNS